MATQPPPTIFSFPVELAQHILSFCRPSDVATFSKTCRAAFTLVYQPTDQYLWRQLYISSFDPPCLVTDPTSRKEEVNWKNELTSRMKVELALFHGPTNISEKQDLLRMLITIIQDSSRAVSQTGSSHNIAWLKRFTCQSLLLHNLYSGPESEDDAQIHAQLRAYFALTIDPKHDKNTLAKLVDRRDLSRAYVYNLLHYKEENRWGPFLPDGRVNWIHAEHLIDVVALNIRELPGSWALTRPPSCLDPPRLSTRTFRKATDDDWAGVEGTWRRYVCFMDYRDLFAFNFTDLADGPRHPKFFKDPRFREATRLIEVKLHIVPSNELRFHRICNPTNNREAYPLLCFTGSSKGVNGNEAAVEGSVVMGKDGIARWQLISIYDNHPQWSSSGVQIGGVGSVMGVIGVWTTTHHDEDDPAGPFWLWKVEDNSPTHLMEFT